MSLRGLDGKVETWDKAPVPCTYRYLAYTARGRNFPLLDPSTGKQVFVECKRVHDMREHACEICRNYSHPTVDHPCSGCKKGYGHDLKDVLTQRQCPLRTALTKAKKEKHKLAFSLY